LTRLPIHRSIIEDEFLKPLSRNLRKMRHDQRTVRVNTAMSRSSDFQVPVQVFGNNRAPWIYLIVSYNVRIKKLVELKYHNIFKIKKFIIFLFFSADSQETTPGASPRTFCTKLYEITCSEAIL